MGTLRLAGNRYREFISGTAIGDGFRLTPHAEPTPYARCFALFGLQLLQDRGALAQGRELWSSAIRRDLRACHQQRLHAGADLRRDKPYLQLLTFSLSALALLGTLHEDPLDEEVRPLLSMEVGPDLDRLGVAKGVPGSGNQAMFIAILLLHARDWLAIDTRQQLADWERYHLMRLNRFGFWGPATSMSHRLFQNGYHQYEILEYLDTQGVPWDQAASQVAGLADHEGHFAPYPGGGGCFDYDAVFLLSGQPAIAQRHRPLLERTARTLLAEQNPDGGFCESLQVRPRSIGTLARAARHVARATGAAQRERLRQALTLLRPRHDRIHTHWSQYSRHWYESDLWDSWFRMLALARIDVAADPSRAGHWGFIAYPGIGYHPCLHARRA